MPNLDELNKRAQDSFDRLKQKQRWTPEKIKELNGKASETVSAEKIMQLFEQVNNKVHTKQLDETTTTNEDSLTVKSMDFIDSLNLSHKLSLAIGYVIASKIKDREHNLLEAIRLIQEEVR